MRQGPFRPWYFPDLTDVGQNSRREAKFIGGLTPRRLRHKKKQARDDADPRPTRPASTGYKQRNQGNDDTLMPALVTPELKMNGRSHNHLVVIGMGEGNLSGIRARTAEISVKECRCFS
jgi:hypothetical protein